MFGRRSISRRHPAPWLATVRCALAISAFGIALQTSDLAADGDRGGPDVVNHGTLLFAPHGFMADDLDVGGRWRGAGPLSRLSRLRLDNRPGATIYGHGPLPPAAIANRGIIEFNGPTEVAGDLSNEGTVRVGKHSAVTFLGAVVHNGAEFDLATDSRAVFLGPVSGAGAFSGAGAAVFAGSLSPGNSPALVTFAGDVTFGPSNVLEIEIGGLSRGTEYDALDVDGTATLDGTLQVILIDGFVPTAGDRFDIVVATTVVGQIAATQVPPLDPPHDWVVEYDLDPVGDDTVRLCVDTCDPGSLVAGDIDGDGQRTVIDLLWLQQALTGSRALTQAEQQRADVYPTGGDDVIDVSDLNRLQQLVVP